MSRQINQPINQVRLTNVAVVRMNQGGKRFEIACYRNKVVDYRQGLEQDLSEVLQTERVFTNVSKGQFAKAQDLLKVFKTKDEDEICKLILQKGQLQVSDKERNQQLEKTIAQVAEWISKNCVHPTSGRPYTISQIRHAMQQANFAVHATKPLKRQYLDCVKVLQSVIPIQRAKMELALYVPQSNQDVLEEAFEENDIIATRQLINDTNNNDIDAMVGYKVLVDPSLYRVLNEVIQDIPNSKIDIVMQVVTQQGDVDLEREVERRNNNTTTTTTTNTTTAKNIDKNNNSIENTVTEKVQDEMDNLAISSSSSPAANNTGQATMKDDNEQTDDLLNSENHHDDNEENDDDDDDYGMTQNRRKAQKKAKKKKKKSNRRNQQRNNDDDNDNDNDDNNVETESDNNNSPKQNDDNNNNVQQVVVPSSNNNNAGGGGGKSCNTCGGTFDPAAYRAHFKSDWHRFNQKLKLSGRPPVSEQEFLLCDSDTFFGEFND